MVGWWWGGVLALVLVALVALVLVVVLVPEFRSRTSQRPDSTVPKFQYLSDLV